LSGDDVIMEIEKKLEIKFKERTKIDDLEIESAIIRKVRIPLNMTFSISLGSQDYYEGVLIELKAGEFTGYGEGETVAQITGEDPEVLFHTVLGIVSSIDGHAFSGMEEASSFINSYCHGNTASKSAVEMSLYDLVSRKANLHLTRILGGNLNPRRTSLTIPINSVQENIRLLEQYKKQGAKIIKVKVGKDVENDLERVKGIANNLPDDTCFFVDANQGYNLRQAIKMADLLQKYEALFFEQPMPRDDLYGLRDLRNKSGVPIMLDESISSPRDVLNAVMIGSADMINVKLSKSGGIRNAIKVLTVAQAAGLDAMVGCMLESKLGIAASLAVANTLSNVKYIDLDGFTYLQEQPFEGGVEMKNGMDIPISGPGLAANPVSKML